MKKFLLKFFAFVLVFITFVYAGCEQQNEAVKRKESKTQTVEKFAPRGVLHKRIETRIEEPTVLSGPEKKRKQVAEQFDKEGLLYSGRVVVDRDKKMLEAPDSMKQFIGKEFIIAKTAPEIEFGIVPLKPKFFAELPEGKGVGYWSNWSQGNYYPPTGKFYSSVGDHAAYDAHLYIVEYDPLTKTITCSPEINRLLGVKKEQFSDGKIHGWLDFYDGPWLWFATYWAKEPQEQDYATGYQGGHILSFNVLTGDIVDYGVPMVRASWVSHRVDTKRGIFYAVGAFGEFLAWDIREQKTLYAGYLPKGMSWYVRAILIDEDTGMVYTSSQDASDMEKHLIKYDPFKNRFFKLECRMPKDKIPAKGTATGGYHHMRACTAHRGPDRLFWGITSTGELFTFNPEKEEVIEKGINRPGEHRYTRYMASMARSPKGRYIYYLPAVNGKSFVEGFPVIQYDTKTGKKKALAFLYPYYNEKYGYTTGGTFSINLDDRGERLFVLMNGAFVDIQEYLKKEPLDVFADPSVFLIHIPESERAE